MIQLTPEKKLSGKMSDLELSTKSPTNYNLLMPKEKIKREGHLGVKSPRIESWDIPKRIKILDCF